MPFPINSIKALGEIISVTSGLDTSIGYILKGEMSFSPPIINGAIGAVCSETSCA